MIGGIEGFGFSWWVFPVLAWILLWKAMAMWRAARNNQIFWFVACLVINTIGVLPMIYLVFFQRDLNPSKKGKVSGRPTKKKEDKKRTKGKK